MPLINCEVTLKFMVEIDTEVIGLSSYHPMGIQVRDQLRRQLASNQEAVLNMLIEDADEIDCTFVKFL